MSDDFTELDATRPAPGATERRDPDDPNPAAPPLLAPPLHEPDEEPGATSDGPETADASPDAVALSDAPQDPVRPADRAVGDAALLAVLDVPEAAEVADDLATGAADALEGADVLDEGDALAGADVLDEADALEAADAL